MYIFQSKDDVYGKFKDFKLLVENQAKTKNKCPRPFVQILYQQYFLNISQKWHDLLAWDSFIGRWSHYLEVKICYGYDLMYASREKN